MFVVNFPNLNVEVNLIVVGIRRFVLIITGMMIGQYVPFPLNIILVVCSILHQSVSLLNFIAVGILIYFMVKLSSVLKVMEIFAVSQVFLIMMKEVFKFQLILI